MNRPLQWLTLIGSVLTLLAYVQTARSQENLTHHYGITAPPAYVHHGVPVEYAAPLAVPHGYVAPRSKTPYAYGWFGVQRRCHPGYSEGFYRNRPQWKYR